jgi:hypothetical protein
MRKLALILALLAGAVIVSYAQSREEIYDLAGLYMSAPYFVYDDVDANGYVVTKKIGVKGLRLEYTGDELVGFALLSGGKAEVEFPVYKWISESGRIRKFWVDDSGRYYVVLAKQYEPYENGMSIDFISNINGSSMFHALFTRHFTEEELAQMERERQEKQRLEEEKKRKEQEKAARLAAERRAKIEAFLIEREDKVYDMESLNYSQLKDKMRETLTSSAYFSQADYVTMSIKDSVLVNYKGKIRHNIDVSGSDSNLKKKVESDLLKVKSSPMLKRVRGTDTLCSVNSQCVISLKMEVRRYGMTVKLNNKGQVALKKGDKEHYLDAATEIRKNLNQGKGVYDIAIYKKWLDSKYVGVGVEVLKFK